MLPEIKGWYLEVFYLIQFNKQTHDLYKNTNKPRLKACSKVTSQMFMIF